MMRLYFAAALVVRRDGVEEERQQILLVDDEPVLALFLARMLEQRGYSVVVAFSGEEAMQMCAHQHALDLILMDLNLGEGADGIQVARHLSRSLETPIMFLSGQTDMDLPARTRGAGAFGIVEKNAPEEVLCASISMAIELSRIRRQHPDVLVPSSEPGRKKAGMLAAVGASGRLAGYGASSSGLDGDSEVPDLNSGGLQLAGLALKELQHRTKNTLAMISTLVEIERNQAALPETRSALDRLLQRTRSFSTLYSLLWASSGNLRLDEYLRTLAETLAASCGGAHTAYALDMDMEPLRSDMAILSNLGIMLTEALTNSFRHASVPGQDLRIVIRLWTASGSIHLRIRDDGKGFSCDANHCGFGFALIRELTGQMNGTYRIRGEDGMDIELEIPQVR